MHVKDKLREPFLPIQLRDGLRLNEIEHEPIAIIIVPGVMMIQLRRRCAFALGAERLAIPICDNINAVGIRRRNKQKDRVLKYLFGLSVVCRREIIRKIHRHLRRHYLGRVYRASDRDNRFAVLYEIVEFTLIAYGARVSQSSADAAVFFEVLDVVSRRYESDD